MDVFYLHPTTNYGSAATNAAIENRKAVEATNVVLMAQAAAFNSVGRIYAPRYRQMAIYLFDESEDALQGPLNLAYEDLRQAFRTYLEHLNQGRPFIIAGHSPWANHAQRLLIEEVVGRPCAERFVAAWIPGLALPRAMLDSVAGGGLAPVSPRSSPAVSPSGEIGQDLRYQIRMIYRAQSFEATGLPAGLILDAQTGSISGLPQAAGAFAMVLRVTNPHGTEVAELALTIRESTARSSRRLQP